MEATRFGLNSLVPMHPICAEIGLNAVYTALNSMI
jgi:hypothetical protein